MDQHFQTSKSYLSKIINDHPFILLSLLAAGFWLLVSTVLFAIYPEVVSDTININQFFLICLFYTSFLAIIFILPGLMFLLISFVEKKHIHLLSFNTRFGLAFAEFYFPNIYLILLFLFPFFEFNSMYKLIISVVLILLACIILWLLYRFSWTIYYRIDSRELLLSKEKQLKKLDYLPKYAMRIVCTIFCTLSSLLIIFEVLFKNTWTINIYADGIKGYGQFATVISIVFLPSLIICTIRNWKGILGGFIVAFIIIISIVTKNLSPTYHWLARHHIANFNDYRFIVNKVGCDELERNSVPIQRIENNKCNILVPFKVISAIGDNYKIQLNTGKFNEKIEHIKKKNVNHITEMFYSKPIQSNLDRDVELFSKLYNLDILVALKNPDNQALVSTHGISEKFDFKIKMNSDKALVLGSYLTYTRDLIKLEDKASLIHESYSGTIIDSLKNDSNDKFFRLLISRLENAFRQGEQLHVIGDIIRNFVNISRKDNYNKVFSELEYWKLISFNNEQVVEVLHNQKGFQFLFLYFQQQELAMVIGVKNPKFILTLSDNRIQNFIQAIMRNNSLA